MSTICCKVHARKRERNSTESKQHFLLRNVLLKLHFCIEVILEHPPDPGPELGFVAKVKQNEKTKKHTADERAR